VHRAKRADAACEVFIRTRAHIHTNQHGLWSVTDR